MHFENIFFSSENLKDNFLFFFMLTKILLK